MEPDVDGRMVFAMGVWDRSRAKGSAALAGLVAFVVTLLLVPTTLASAGASPAEVSTDATSSPLTVQTSASLNTTKNISVGLSIPWGVAVDPANGYVFVSDSNGQDVAVVSASTGELVTSIKVDNGSAYPNAMYYDSSNGYLYVVDGGIGVLTIINPSTLLVVKQIPLGSLNGGFYWGLIYDPVLGDLILTGNGDTKLTYLNTATNKLYNITYSIGCWVGSWEGVYDSYSNQIIIPDDCTNQVRILSASTLAVINNFTVGAGQPGPIAYDPVTGDVYVPSRGTDSLYVANATNDTVVAEFFPNGWFNGFSAGEFASYDPSSKLIYAGLSDHLAVFDPQTNATEGNISLPGSGMNIAYDSSDSDLFVADSELTEVLTKPPPKLLDATFVASVLSPGLTWSVKVNGVRLYSTSDTVVFAEKKATYSYKVYPPGGYSATPSSGTVNLTKHNQTVSVTLTATKFYTVTFVQSGLPSGFVWSVSINGGGTAYGKSGSSSGSTVKLKMPNGVWGYSEQVPSGYSVFPTGGSVRVSGSTPSPQQVTVSPEVNVGVGDGITGLAYSSWSGTTFVSQQYSGNVSVINDTRNQVVTNITVGTDPEAIISTPVNPNIYVANSGSNTVSVINGSSLNVVTSIGVGSEPYFLYYDPVVQEVYVSDSGTDTVSAISVKTDSVVATITVAGSPQWITEDLSTGYLYVANADECTTGTCYPISVISDSTDTVVTNIASNDIGTFNAFGGPSIAYDPSNQDVYLLGSYYLYVLSTSSDTFIQSLVLGTSNYGGLLYNPVTGNMLVSGYNTSVNVVESSTNSLLKSIPVASSPGAPVYIPTADRIYVANTGGRSVAVLNASTESLMGQVTVGYTPVTFSFDPNVSNLYVGCWPSTVSVVFPPKTFPISSWPAITQISTITTDSARTVTISGTGFGQDPSLYTLSDGSVDTIASSVTPSLVISDASGGTSNWSAGHETSSNMDAIGIYLVSWTTTKIIFDGFGLQLGSTWTIEANNSLTISVFGPENDGTATYESLVSPSPSVSELNLSLSTLHVLNVSSSGAITALSSLTDHPGVQCNCGNSNLSGFTNLTNERSGSDFLNVSYGSIDSASTYLVGFTATSASWRIVVSDSIVYNSTMGAYYSTVVADFNPPAGRDINLSDLASFAFAESVNSSFGKIIDALDSLASGYESSYVTTLVTLGDDYLLLEQGVQQLRTMLPAKVAGLALWDASASFMDQEFTAPVTEAEDAFDVACEIAPFIAYPPAGFEELFFEDFALAPGIHAVCSSFIVTAVSGYNEYAGYVETHIYV